MNIRRIFLLFLTFSAVQVVSGKEIYKKGSVPKKSYGTNRFFDNIFIGVAGGVNLYMGDHDGAFGIEKRLTPALDAYIGKWFTPWIGGRVAYSGLYARGWSITPPYLGDGKMTGEYFNEEFSTMYVHADFMWNISNAIGGYRHNRFWNFIPYIGAGYIRLEQRHGCNFGHNIAASAGLYNTLRLSKTIDITLDVREMILGSGIAAPGSGSGFDYMTTASVGLSFKISNKRFRKTSGADASYYKGVIKDLKAARRRADQKAEELSLVLGQDKARMQKSIDSLSREVSEKVPQEPEKMPVVPIALFFEVGKPDLGAKEMVNLNFYVRNAIKADPGRVFTITGIADNSSGSRAGNRALAEKRVSYVYDLLVNEYGISPDRLVNKGVVGDDMFPDSRLNRVVIIE